MLQNKLSPKVQEAGCALTVVDDSVAGVEDPENEKHLLMESWLVTDLGAHSKHIGPCL